jgi:hemolysin activation/secretion protein
LRPEWRALAFLVSMSAVLSAAAPSSPQNPSPPAPPEPAIYISEYRVDGARLLPAVEVEEAVYPFLGPGRTSADVEQARAALEAAYKAKGFQTVSVEVPQQDARGGVVLLQVSENKVGRLRIKGSRYFSLSRIRQSAPSMAEGKVVNFNEVTRDIVALNQWPDRRITPTLRAGVEPGTVDIDLSVKDNLPLHGSLELNNRRSPDTTELRLNGSISYANLWQLGHAIGLNVQIAPQRLDDAKIYSAYYLARVPGVDWLTLMLQGTKQDSDVSTLGGAAAAGRGRIVGGRAIIALPNLKDFYHSVSLGLDYKHFDQGLTIGTDTTTTPITYYPLSATYSGTWSRPGAQTELNAGVTLSFRGAGSDEAEFDSKRFESDGGFIYLRGDLTHTRDLPKGFEMEARLQGQLAGQPLIDSEQWSGGGLGTVRGYLESEAVGDNGVFGSLELRSPSLSAWIGKKILDEWRIYIFGEGGVLTLNKALAEQDSRFELASVGVGSRIRVGQHFNGSIDAGLPLISQTHTQSGDLLLTFRLWADF